MTARFAWVSMLVAAGTALAMLLAALAFLPTPAWESFVPLATIIGAGCVLAAAAAAGWAGRGLARPLRRLVQAVEADEIGDEKLREFAGGAPAEIAGLLYALHHAHTRLQRTLRHLEQDRAEMATIFHDMADGLLVVDAFERIELSNPAADRLLRATAPVGRQLAAVSRDAELVELARAAREGRPVVQMIELHSRSPAPSRWVQVSATRLPDRERTLVLLQDVTDLRRAEAARRDLVANVSHELKTPVASLKALVETLEAGALHDPECGPDFLRRMHVEVDGLAQLIAELLELARIEAGRLDLDLRPCSANQLICEAMERIRPYASRVGLEVRTSEIETDLVVHADPRQIGQVLGNLLSNAVKFTPPGGHIELGARRDGAFIELWVTDTGVGLAGHDLIRVFERFYKTDPSRTGSGTGLGLAICKHVVQAHGGTIYAESDGLGSGASFHFTLPVVDT